MKSLFFKIGLFLLPTLAFSQELKKGSDYNVVCVAFYNLENLYDTIIDPDPNKILQDEFTPNGDKQFNSQRYQQKLTNMAKVISELGTESQPDGPAILGVCEVENRRVLEDLVTMPAIRLRNYKIVHYDSPDRRGVDVALLYQEKYFSYQSSKTFTLKNPSDSTFFTRDQLLVTGTIGNETFHFMVAHWPSRRGGEKQSRPLRILAAELGMKIMDSIRKTDPSAKIIYMGDLNDDPVSYSIKNIIKSEGDVSSVEQGEFYNPMEKLFNQGIGTLAYKDNWNLFDQFICTSSLVPFQNDFSQFKFYRAKVYNVPYLKSVSGNFAGYPFRTYVGSTWQGGYSDHFPVFMYLVKEK
jgi:hypothetical protein